MLWKEKEPSSNPIPKHKQGDLGESLGLVKWIVMGELSELMNARAWPVPWHQGDPLQMTVHLK